MLGSREMMDEEARENEESVSRGLRRGEVGELRRWEIMSWEVGD